MSDGSAPFWPGSRELEAVVHRAVAEQVDAVSSQMGAVSRALALLAARLPEPRHVDEVSARLDALASRLDEVAPSGTSLASLAELPRLAEKLDALDALVALHPESRRAEIDELRQTAATAVSHSVAKIDQARKLDLDQVVERITGVATALEQGLVWLEATVTADSTRVLDEVAALEAPLTRDAVARQAQLDDLRHTVATTVDQAVSRIEAARTEDLARIVEQVGALLAKAGADGQRRDEQAAALLAAVDERLLALHVAGNHAGDASAERLATRLEAISSEHREALLARIDERTAAVIDLDAIPTRLAAEVHQAAARALTSQVEPLVTRLVEAIDALAHEGGRIEALARGHAGEARAVEERVATMFSEVAERAESAVDRSRGRIAEGQVALGTKLDAVTADLLEAVTAAADRLEARTAESAELLRAAGGHQNGALLDAVTRNAQQLGEGLAEVRSAVAGAGAESAARHVDAAQKADALIKHLDGLRTTIESARHDPRLDALVVEQVAARDAQLAALEAISTRIDEVGPLVARALLPEVQRATRAANATEEAVAGLRPDDLRAAVLGGAGQEGGSAARLDALEQSLGDALAELASAVATSRAELRSLTTRALEQSAAAADEAVQASGTAIDDVRASQATLREAVQDGAHKAELAALDVRGLRERLAPHLVALAEATTRRAEADQAGFDAVLARLDQLLASRQR